MLFLVLGSYLGYKLGQVLYAFIAYKKESCRISKNTNDMISYYRRQRAENWMNYNPADDIWWHKNLWEK
jgi:hypothetical protein